MLIAHQVQHHSQLDRQTEVLSMSEVLASVYLESIAGETGLWCT